MEEFELKGKKNPKIKAIEEDEQISFYLDKDKLSDPEVFENFTKSCELMIRKDPRYTNYISFLKENGFNKDVVQSGIDNDKFPNTSIEMHHGPMFNLYELCSIVIDHKLSNDEKVCTFDIADIILTEHEKHNIQVVMGLTKTNHELVHSGKIFIHIKQSLGDILTFIKKYKDGIRRDHLYTLESYLKLCKNNDATENDYLMLSKAAKKIKKYME